MADGLPFKENFLTSRFDPNKKNSDSVKFVVKELCRHMRKSLTDEEWHKYEEQKTDRGLIQLLINSKEIQSCIKQNIQLHPTQKDKAKALVLKTVGNKAFGSGDNEKALHLYTQCLVWMPYDETKDSGVVHANRSAALFHLNELSLAEKDAELAFSLNYPVELHYKLYERVGRCCLLSGKSTEAIKNLQRAIKALEISELDESKREKTKKSLEQIMKACPNTNQNASEGTNNLVGRYQSPVQPPVQPEVVGGRGKYLKAASKRLSLQYREKQGRFVVADECFQPGDVILVEKAFVSVLLPQKYHQQCFQCYNPLRAPIPCKQCILVSFCSTKCRDYAWNTHHKYECSILGLLKNSGISVICYMALRVLTQVIIFSEIHYKANPKEVLGWYETASKSEMEEISRKSAPVEVSTEKSNNCSNKMSKGTQESLGFNEEYRTDHVALFNLVTHSQLRRTEDFFHQLVMAVYLLEALKSTSYFKSFETVSEPQSNSGTKLPSAPKGNGDWSSNDALQKNGESSCLDVPTKTSISLNEEGTKGSGSVQWEVEVRFAYLLLRCLQTLQFNAHETSGWDTYRDKDNSVGLGGACYPTLALFNHSCNPAVVRYFVNDTVIVRAVRTILPGEVVHENYGQVFTTTRKEERQAKLLDHYWFNCDCIACREDWPTFECMTNEKMSFRCQNCRTFVCKSDENMGILFSCGKCGKSVNILKSLKSLQESEKAYNKALEFLESGNEETGLEILLQNISLLDSYLMPPYRDYHLCQENVRKCLLNLGNKISQQPFWEPEKVT